MRSLLAALVAAVAAASAPAASKPWSPVPPCTAPVGVDSPAVPESMCSNEVARRGAIVVREYGLPAAATLAQVRVDDQVFAQARLFGTQLLLEYFVKENHNIGRTVPISVRNLGDRNTTWLVGMMVSTAQYPDSGDIPAPSQPVELEPVGLRTLAAVQFNTSSLPAVEDYDRACGRLLAGPLPKGYAVNKTSSWTPTYVVYSGEGSTSYTSECWAEVVKG